MLKKLKFLALLLLAFPFAANAALVTLQSKWEYQLHPSSSGVSGLGLFTFTIDDTTPIDSISGNSPFQNAVYVNPITSANFALGSLSLNLDSSKTNSIYISNKDRSGGTDATIRAFLLDDVGTSYEMFLGFEMRRELTTLGLDNLNGLNNEDSPFAYITIGACTNPFACGYSLQQVGVQSAVPIPASGWLFASSALGLVLGRLKQKKAR